MPLSNIRKEDLTIHPRGIIYLILFLALLALANATAGGNHIMAAIVIALPVGIIILIAGVQYPMFSFTVYCTIMCYFHAIYRYAHIEGLSVICDIFLGVCLLSIIMNIASRNQKLLLNWRNALNTFSVGELVWIMFVLFEFFIPYTKFDDPVKTRGFFLSIPLSYLLCGLLLDSPRKLRLTLILLAIFVATAAAKLYWQKNRGFDSAELRFLFEEDGASTHILNDGIRYFSFFSDAGNFGASMGVLTTVFMIAAFVLRRFWLRCICLAAAVLAVVGLFMSGTRGAIVVPFVGMLLFIFLSKNPTAIVTTFIGGVFAFCFFYFTNIGDGNDFIRRIRTAFRPNEDASYNVRVENQKRIAYYLKEKPFGLGLGGQVIDLKGLMNKDENGHTTSDFSQRRSIHQNIPPDSYLVEMWIAHGIVGVVIFLIFFGIVLIRCSYVLLFKVRNPQLRQVLAGMVGAVCGLLANAYVGRSMGSNPCSLLVAIFLSFVLNAPHIDKQLEPNENI